MLERLGQQVSPYRQARRWWVAYSGGLDSHVLLHSLCMLAKNVPDLPPIGAIHVNHQIQLPANAWEEHCRQQALNLGIEFISFRVTVDGSGNLEENARQARYSVFEDLLGEGDCLFMAHHADDNVETFFYRLFRGAGLVGLQAIHQHRPLGRGTLVRPLLQFSRSMLESYAKERSLQFIIDPSNADSRFDRNYIRHNVIPVILQRWPGLTAVISRTMENMQEADLILNEIATEDLGIVNIQEYPEPAIRLKVLNSLSLARQNNVLRFWLGQYGYSLGKKQWCEISESVIHARPDANPVFQLRNHSLRRYRDMLVLVAEKPVRQTLICWNGLEACHVPGYGTLELMPPMAINLEIRPRQGGETIKLAGRQHMRKLKVLLQELDLPPWEREALPLIYYRNELIAAGELLLSESGLVLLDGSKIRRSSSFGPPF